MTRCSHERFGPKPMIRLRLTRLKERAGGNWKIPERHREPSTPASSTFERRRPKEMPQNGLNEMDKRADARSSWRVFALVALGAVATKLLMSGIAGLFGKGTPPDDAPK
jgi:hypothetical protein